MLAKFTVGHFSYTRCKIVVLCNLNYDLLRMCVVGRRSEMTSCSACGMQQHRLLTCYILWLLSFWKIWKFCFSFWMLVWGHAHLKIYPVVFGVHDGLGQIFELLTSKPQKYVFGEIHSKRFYWLDVLSLLHKHKSDLSFIMCSLK